MKKILLAVIALMGSVILYGQGVYQMWGMTNKGGANNSGAIFQWLLSQNKLKQVYDFHQMEEYEPNGAFAYYNGKLYGTVNGGVNNAGRIFEIDPATGRYTSKVDFSYEIGRDPYGSLTLFNSKFYGMTYTGGLYGIGTVYEWNPATNVLSKKYDFAQATGAYPRGSLVVWSNKLYGMTNVGGTNGGGVIFEFDPSDNKYIIRADNILSEGSGFYGKLTLVNNKFFGMASSGGIYNKGVLFEFNPATNIYTKRIDFNGENGSFPFGSLTFYEGRFYGTTYRGGTFDSGIIFEWNPETNELYKKIDLNELNGGRPYSSLTLFNRTFFGMTNSGGYHNLGVFFSWDPTTNIYTKLRDFQYTEGNRPFLENELISIPAPVSFGLANTCTSFPSITIDATNNNRWVSITDKDGNAVAEIKANGNNLGIVTVSMFINGGAVRKDKNNQFYLDRNITITPQLQPKTPVDVRLYIKATEYEALKNAANIKGKPNAIDSITDVKIYPVNIKCSPTAAALGNTVSTIADNWENDYVLSASVSTLSSFFFAAKTTCAPPTISNMLISTDTLWPPRHSLRGISVAYKTSGDCKCDPVTRWLTVKSNEPISGTGTADKSPDWVILDANHVYLRAERSDRGTGRIYTITINAKNTAGAVSTYDFTVAVPLTMPAAKAAAIAAKQLQEKEVPEQLFNCSILPNPSAGYFNLQVETASAERIEVRVIDMSGTMIKSLTASNHQPLRFGNDLMPGVYMIKVVQGQQQQIIKVIKQ